jgi:hypothetical protein
METVPVQVIFAWHVQAPHVARSALAAKTSVLVGVPTGQSPFSTSE